MALATIGQTQIFRAITEEPRQVHVDGEAGRCSGCNVQGEGDRAFTEAGVTPGAPPEAIGPVSEPSRMSKKTSKKELNVPWGLPSGPKLIAI